ncbi:hypothetical protein T11_15608, partial [Trichinella zimbabwensis]
LSADAKELVTLIGSNQNYTDEKNKFSSIHSRTVVFSIKHAETVDHHVGEAECLETEKPSVQFVDLHKLIVGAKCFTAAAARRPNNSLSKPNNFRYLDATHTSTAAAANHINIKRKYTTDA